MGLPIISKKDTNPLRISDWFFKTHTITGRYGKTTYQEWCEHTQKLFQTKGIETTIKEGYYGNTGEIAVSLFYKHSEDVPVLITNRQEIQVIIKAKPKRQDPNDNRYIDHYNGYFIGD